MSILVIFIALCVYTFSNASFTFITIPFVFALYVLVFSVCQVVPPSKLYAFSANPTPLSLASTVNVTGSFVHSVMFFVTDVIWGSATSMLIIFIPLCVYVFPNISLTFINIPAVFSLYVFVFLDCQLVPPSKLYAFSANPTPTSLAITVIVTGPFVHSVVLRVTDVTSGFIISILVIFISVCVYTFSNASFTFITIPSVFELYVLVFSACQVVPPSKLYAFSANPAPASVAVTVSVTGLFVHSVVLFITDVTCGFVVSILVIFIALCVYTFPSVSLTFITIPFVFVLYVLVFPVCQVVPPSKLYGVACNPEALYSVPPISITSLTPFIVNVTEPFVHSVVFCVTFVIVGALSSIFKFVDFVASFPALSIAFTWNAP